MTNEGRTLKVGYHVRVYRQVVFGKTDEVQYCLRQRQDEQYISWIIILDQEGNEVDRSSKGSLPPSDPDDIPISILWLEHRGKAISLLEEWKANGNNLDDYPYETHYFRESDGREVSREEATAHL